MRENFVEDNLIHKIDSRKDSPELRGQGFPAEKVTLNFYNSMGLETRFTTPEEDAGIRGIGDIGPKLTIDGVVYKEKKPIMSPQITTSQLESVRKKKMAELKDKPFIRLGEMKPGDISIPKVLIYLDAKGIAAFETDPDFSRHPELALQIIDSSLLSLKFDLSQTKNPLEQKAVQELIKMFEQEKKKYIH